MPSIPGSGGAGLDAVIDGHFPELNVGPDGQRMAFRPPGVPVSLWFQETVVF